MEKCFISSRFRAGLSLLSPVRLLGPGIVSDLSRKEMLHSIPGAHLFFFRGRGRE